MEARLGRNNAKGLFGLETIPSYGQMRNLLNPVGPSHVRAPFWEICDRLQAGKYLDEYRSIGGTLLCSLDGTRFFASQNINCSNYTVHVHEGQAHHSHMVLAAVLVAPGKEHVIALDPEFITPQDGHDKQDCEQQAIKRWVKRNAERSASWGATILTDDLHSHQPLCELLLKHELHFIMTCSTESHQALYKEVELLTRENNAVQTVTVRRPNGRYHELGEYRWVDQVPIRAGAKALRVIWW